MDGPGTGCAFVMCDQLAILCTPLEYCSATVFPELDVCGLRAHASMRRAVPTDVRELPVLEDLEIVLGAEVLQPLDHRVVEVFDDIYMCLNMLSEWELGFWRVGAHLH